MKPPKRKATATRTQVTSKAAKCRYHEATRYRGNSSTTIRITSEGREELGLRVHVSICLRPTAPMVSLFKVFIHAIQLIDDDQ